MIYKLNPDTPVFPDPEQAEENGLVAFGGKLSTEWLLEAYCSGLFPWFEDEEGDPYWFCPQERMVLRISDFAPHKSLRRVCRSGRFEVRVDTCFEEVMRACATTPRNYEPSGSWITEDFIRAYTDLYKQGFAHSFETFRDGQLVGGLYGVSLGDWFFGESMFHHETDASKVAFCAMVDYCRLHGLRWVDCQMETEHLASLGARVMPRTEFLSHIYEMGSSLVCRWQPHSVVLLLGTNEGDRNMNLQIAAAFVETEIGHITCESSIHETAPWGQFDEEEPQPFLNQALVVDTDLTPHQVLHRALEIETLLGRNRQDPQNTSQFSILNSQLENSSQFYHSRPIDIDLIFYDSEVISTPDLTLPHPRAHLRSFVLDPLCEIIPDYLHPTLHRPVSDLQKAMEKS